MKYVYMCLTAAICFFMAKFFSGVATELFETSKHTDVIVFVFGSIYGVISMVIQWIYDKKETTNDQKI